MEIYLFIYLFINICMVGVGACEGNHSNDTVLNLEEIKIGKKG